MSSKAQVKASQKYNKNNTKAYQYRFNLKTDADIIQRLAEVDNQSAYLKKLIRDDIAKHS